jgi:N-acyl-D-aspartate/D-glutamate deacylase
MFDIVIAGGSVLDGSGRAPQRLDVGIEGGRITALGDLSGAETARVIDAAGKTVCPGFLDLHRHADAAVLRPGYGPTDLFQGVTTIANGNCGLSLAPQFGPHTGDIAAYLHPVTGDFDETPVSSLTAYHKALEQHGLPVNVLTLAGGGTIRATVAGFSKVRLEDDDYKAIHALLEKTLQEGAGGVSLGLGYAPECFYTTEELIRALEPIRNSGVVLSAHVRGEAMHLLESHAEMLTVAKELQVPLQISHLKGTGRENWGKLIPEALRRLARAREDGMDVTCDAYPFTAGSTQLIHILPPEFLQGGTAILTEKLRDPQTRRALKERLRTGRDFDNYVYLVGWENIAPSSVKCPEDERYLGRSIAESAGSDDPADFAFDLLVRSRCEVTMIDKLTDENDIAAIYKSPFAYAVSDATYPTTGRLHPRVYGAFTQIIERFVNQRHDLTLAEAVNRMTWRPAQRYRLPQKGRIVPGADADILVFSPEKIHMAATFQEPARFSEGMEYVLVNGKTAIDGGKLSDIHAGTVIRAGSLAG